MKCCAALFALLLLIQSSPVIAQNAQNGPDGSFIRRRMGGRIPARNSGSMDWDLMNKPGSNFNKSGSGSSKLFDNSPTSASGPRTLPNGTTLSTDSAGNRTFAGRNGMQRTLGPNGSGRFTRPDGSVYERGADGSLTLRNPNGKESVINPDGSGVLQNGSKITKNNVDNSTTVMRKDGLGFQTNSDGSKVFKRSNGLETVKTPEGKVYMRYSDTGTPTGRELKK